MSDMPNHVLEAELRALREKVKKMEARIAELELRCPPKSAAALHSGRGSSVAADVKTTFGPSFEEAMLQAKTLKRLETRAAESKRTTRLRPCRYRRGDWELSNGADYLQAVERSHTSEQFVVYGWNPGTRTGLCIARTESLEMAVICLNKHGPTSDKFGRILPPEET